MLQQLLQLKSLAALRLLRLRAWPLWPLPGAPQRPRTTWRRGVTRGAAWVQPESLEHGESSREMSGDVAKRVSRYRFLVVPVVPLGLKPRSSSRLSLSTLKKTRPSRHDMSMKITYILYCGTHNSKLGFKVAFQGARKLCGIHKTRVHRVATKHHHMELDGISQRL